MLSMGISVVFASLCLLFSAVAQDTHATPPQETYLQIYLMIQEAERLESSGQVGDARQRYQKALSQLQQLQQDYKDWEPVIVRYRISYCKEKLNRLPASSETSAPAVQESSSQPVVAPAVVTPAIVESSATVAGDDTSALRTRIRQLEADLASTKRQLSEALSVNQDLKERQQDLEKQIATLRQGSNDAKVNDLIAENQKLRQDLDKAKASSASSEQVTQAQQQLVAAQAKLDDANKQITALQTANDDFRKQLESAKAQLVQADKRAKDMEPLAQENSVLRDIVDRALKSQARRDAAARLVDEQLKTLKVDSQVLKTQIDILGSPVVDLKPEERELLRSAPTIAVSVDPQGNISAPLTQGDYASKPRVPTEFRDVADEAVKLFSNRQFDAAAAKYQTILNAYPESLYALSNLGVVRFQQGNYPEAERILREAVRVSPQDAFSHSILGIVLYQQGKYDDAVMILTRAVALDPNDAKSRNYLGISASQKGWQESAEKELRKAIELDPNYGDAHFNLAVIYATQKPPALEMARKHYSRALELGIPRDDQLEKIIEAPKA